MSQLTFGQGTHKLHLPPNSATSLRATVIRTLLNATFYDASPAIIFTILAKPSVDPEFALNVAAIQLFIRSITRHEDKLRILRLIIPQNQDFPVDGPIARFHHLYRNEIYHDTIHKFLNNQLDKHKWQYDLRETYRKTMWMRAARDRSQHFSGIQDGINRHLSLALLKKLTLEADAIQSQLDAQTIASVDASNDPRPKLKILRLLISAGVQTPERDHRHRRRPGSVQCKCGNAAPTIFHISWECKCYEDLREEIWQYMPRPIGQMPICFQYTTLIPSNLDISETQIMGVQEVLIRIWQRQIQDWYDTTEDFPDVPQNPSSSQTENHPSQGNEETTQPSGTQSSQPAIKRGHVLRLIPSGGVFCCRCGMQTKNMKHQRLKILSKKCKFPDLEPSQWLKPPGFHQSINRIQEAEATLNHKYNPGKHQLIWNRALGKDKKKPDDGKIWCQACGRSWPWAYRMTNLNKTVCSPLEIKPTPPERVQILPHYKASNQTNDSDANSSISRVRRRLVGKQTVTKYEQPAANVSGAASSSSTPHPRQGVG